MLGVEVYKDIPTLSKLEIERILSNPTAALNDVKVALYSANMFHDFEFAAHCALEVLDSEDGDRCASACDVVVTIMQTRKSNVYADEFVEKLRKCQQFFPHLSEEFGVALLDVEDFRSRFDAR